jgi:hypothetical protein
VTLLGAATGFQSFAAVGNGNTTYYTIASQTNSEWEVGIGTYTTSGTTLARTTVLSSSNSGSLVNFGAGTKDVFVTYPSSRSIYADGTTLTATNSSVLPITSGGTGQTTATAAFTALAPSQGSNSGKYLTTDGTSASWAAVAGISQVTTATTATTLTSTPTLLQITPASYGVTVTLPDATTCPVGGPLHCIDNRGAYPVRIANTSGTLLGFVFAGVVSYINLDNKSTAAGVWAISSNELVGPSALLLTTSFTSTIQVLDLGSSREILLCSTGSASGFKAVVYNKATNTFGAVTLIRATAIPTTNWTACVSATDQVLVLSCSSTTAFEAVTLSISGTTITVNTAATATLSANINAFADGCGLIAVGSSFVTSYTVTTPEAQIRALSISGTTVTIGSATVLDGSNAGLMVNANNTGVITLSWASTTLYTNYYGVSGTTLTTGTGATSSSGTYASNGMKLTALGTRWAFVAFDGTAGTRAGVISLSVTVVTMSIVVMVASTGEYPTDAMVVGSTKLLVLTAKSSGNANILTDTAGVASAGTAITLDGGTTKAALFVNGTDVYVGSFQTYPGVHRVDCSGASPVLTSSTRAQTNNGNVALTSVSNAVLSRSASKVYGTNFAQIIVSGTAGQTSILTVNASGLSQRLSSYPQNSATLTAEWTPYRGKSNSERWCADGSTVITKMECVA